MTLERVRELLGTPTFRDGSPSDWDDLHRALGVTLPEDYREFVDTYGPGQINVAMVLRHPKHGKRLLGDEMAELAEIQEVNLLHSDTVRSVGVAVGDVLPFSMILGGFVLHFIVDEVDSSGWRIGVFVPGEMVFVEYPWGFSEWLTRYLEADPRCTFIAGSADAPMFSNEFAY